MDGSRSPHPPPGAALESVAPWDRAALPLLVATDVTRRWGRGPTSQLAVDRVRLVVDRGEFVAVVGPSGSGKSTLGAILAGVDQPTSGSLVVDGRRVDRLPVDRLARWRGANVGIVFQDFHLLPTLTAVENVQLAIELANRSGRRRARRDRAAAALDSVGLAAKADRLPAQLSGGEQQRVAVARAIVNDPSLVVADEPTGSLDQESGQVVFELLASVAERGTAVVLITHDRDLAARSDRIVEMLDGRVVADRSPTSLRAAAEVR